MKLTEQDKCFLRRLGYPEEDMLQIQEAANRCKYEGQKSEPLKTKQVIEMLGRETWLSGLSRAAFHWTSCRGEGKNWVYFDCSSMFK